MIVVKKKFPTPRICAFCGRPMGTVAVVSAVLKALGAKHDSSYTHIHCMTKAKKALKEKQ